ncbi:hypothetical protein D3C76_899040 [compost metagenome]
MRVLERRRQQLGNARDTLGQRQVLGDVAGLVAVNEGQTRLRLDRHRLDDDPLQLRLGACVLGQHQFDEGVFIEAGLQQLDELGVMIRREAGGSGGDRHGESGLERCESENAGILGGTEVLGTELFTIGPGPHLKPSPSLQSQRCTNRSRRLAGELMTYLTINPTGTAQVRPLAGSVTTATVSELALISRRRRSLLDLSSPWA